MGPAPKMFYLNFESDFDSVFFFTFTWLCPLQKPWLDNKILSYTISCLPFSNVPKISVYEIFLEFFLCILKSEFYVMFRISIHSNQYVADHHQTLHVLHII